jgi:cell wall-associated NlpC family hydrolase
MTTFDRRLTPARPDLAAAELAGRVSASRYVAGRAMHVAVEAANLHCAPSHEAAIDTQALFGEDVTLYEDNEGWGWVQLARDSYVGYLAINALAAGKTAPTHSVRVNRTFVYPAGNMKLPADFALPLGGRVNVTGSEPPFVQIAPHGFVYGAHLRPCDIPADDFVAIAEGLVGVPYLWGGKTCLGLDCSGLVQIALAEAGIEAPRDTDLQQAALGREIDIATVLSGLQRGDLVFWTGHVGMMRDADTLLHANGHHMLVVSEPLEEARRRTAAQGAGEIAAIRRLPSLGLAR